MNVLPVYDDRYIRNKIRTSGGKVYNDFLSLNVSEDNIECWYFIAISVGSLLVYENKYYLQVYLGNCPYKIVDKQIIDYLGENPFETDEA